jgi:hypothetical protein
MVSCWKMSASFSLWDKSATIQLVSEEEEDTHLHENHQLPHELGSGKTLLAD